MWSWILRELEKAVKATQVNKAVVGMEQEDIVSLAAVRLCQNPKMAKDIYDNKRVGVLYRLVKRVIYEEESKQSCSYKMELSRYQRVLAVCDRYNIEPLPENAYKISALLNDSSNFAISGVFALLSDEVLKTRNSRYFQKSLSDMKKV